VSLSPHLWFQGQCEEAFTFYARLLDGQARMLAFRDTPMAQSVPAAWRDNIVHASLSFPGGTLAGADVLPEHYQRPQGFAVLLDVAGAEAAHRVFNALAEGGSVSMPMQETFWSPAFGVVVDRFGTPWEINGQAGPGA